VYKAASLTGAPIFLNHILSPPAASRTLEFPHMSDQAVEILITNAIHTAFIKYPEGDGGSNLDYEWIAPDQSVHIAKAILQDLAANGYQIVKKGGAIRHNDKIILPYVVSDKLIPTLRPSSCGLMQATS
jgi:hypothetical protein